MTTSVFGIADTAVLAERIVDALLGQGIPAEDISLLVPDGIAIGTIISGSIASHLGNTIPAAHAKRYRRDINKGRILISVRQPDGTQGLSVKTLLEASGAKATSIA